MADVLTRICKDKRAHVSTQKAGRPLAAVEQAARDASPVRGFYKSLHGAASSGKYGLIAEIKKASPSKGLIRENFNPASLARAYERGGATCLSVLTDAPYFRGSDQDLVEARGAVSLPVLRKDFMVDPYQVVEARGLGADCILVILAAVEDGLATELEATASEWGMDTLIEIHDDAELDRALKMRSPLLGINNRNLKTLVTDLDVTRRLAGKVAGSGRLLTSESGLNSPRDLAEMYGCGAGCFLIGESLMRQHDVEAATRKLLTAQPVS